VQIGTAADIYQKPTNKFVADFIGTMNFMPGEVVERFQNEETAFVRTEFCDKLLCRMPRDMDLSPDKKVNASIRPEDIELLSNAPSDMQNVFKAIITHKAYLGNFLYLFLTMKDTKIRVQVPHYVPQEEGQPLYLFLNPEKCNILL
jgi:ABC-type Fe3+/spermidine/putrescine transport system ATPase subunit